MTSTSAGPGSWPPVLCPAITRPIRHRRTAARTTTATGIAMGPIDEVATLDELATRSFADASEDRVPDDGR